jgi:2-C-methyl-D-erythritol 4-phosphate cytidylyltransferase
VSRNRYKSGSAGAVIVAAGESKRMGGQDKLFARIGGEPLLARVLDAFNGCTAIEQIVVVLREEKMGEARRLIVSHDWSKSIDCCIGGRRRQDSVIAGLERLGKYEWVIIHDGARPLVTTDLIGRGLEEAGETGAAVAAVPVTDTIKVAGEDRIVQHTPSRENLWAVQTPQVFRSDIIREAYRRAKEDVTDDASLVERAGHEVKLYWGSYDNIKVTTPDDLALAEILWHKRQE